MSIVEIDDLHISCIRRFALITLQCIVCVFLNVCKVHEVKVGVIWRIGNKGCQAHLSLKGIQGSYSKIEMPLIVGADNPADNPVEESIIIDHISWVPFIDDLQKSCFEGNC